MSHKRTDDEIKEIVEDLDYDLLEIYRDEKYGNKRVHVENSEGYRFDTSLNGLIIRNSPSGFEKHNPFALYNISLWLEKENKTFYLTEDNEFVNNKNKLKFYCEICQEYFLMGWNNLSGGNQNCPICCGQKVVAKTSLGFLYPKLAKEFSEENGTDPFEISPGSNKKVYWICSVCEYRWKVSPNERSYQNHGCPSCSGRVVSDKNRLSVFNPNLVKEWHPTLNKLSPLDVTYKSHKLIYWLCPVCGYGRNGEWLSPPHQRKNSGCPACSNPPKVTTDRNRLTILYPELIAEWNYKRNGNIFPEQFSYGSSKKVWWICPKGHEYESAINSRTTSKTGCKQCFNQIHESFIAGELKKYCINKYNAISEYFIFRNPDTNFYLPYDIYIPGGKIPEINGIYIEINGEQHYKLSYWHKRLSIRYNSTPQDEFNKRMKRDKSKMEFAEKNGYFIEINAMIIKDLHVAVNYLEKELKSIKKGG